jgi:hypothetical protein
MQVEALHDLGRLLEATADNPVYSATMEAEAQAQAAVCAKDSHAGTPDAHGSGSAIPAAGAALAFRAELD